MHMRALISLPTLHSIMDVTTLFSQKHAPYSWIESQIELAGPVSCFKSLSYLYSVLF